MRAGAMGGAWQVARVGNTPAAAAEVPPGQKAGALRVQ